MVGSFELLSPMERRVLQTLLDLGDQKAVARALGIGPETVKTHLRNARAKTGASGSFALARAVAAESGHPPRRGMPPREGEHAASPPAIPAGTPTEPTVEEAASELREVRALFELDGPAVVSRTEPANRRPGTLPRMVMAAALVILVATAILLAFPLSESFQRLADRLDPPKH